MVAGRLSALGGALAAVAAVAVAGCGSATAEGEPRTVTVVVTVESGPEPSGERAEEAPAGTDDAAAPAEAGEEAAAPPAASEAPSAVSALDGLQTVRVSGVAEIDFRVSPDALELVDVRRASGWSHEVDVEEPQRVEIDFGRDADDVEVELEVDARGLEVDVTYEGTAPTGSQTVSVTGVGVLELEVVAGVLRLVAVRPDDGWSHTVDTELVREFEVDLRHADGTRVEVEVELRP